MYVPSIFCFHSPFTSPPSSGIAGWCGNSISNFLGSLHIVSIVAKAIYIPINTVTVPLFCTFSAVLVTSCLLDDSHLTGVRCISLWLLICIPLIISAMEHLSCTCRPFGCLLWKKYLFLHPLYNQIVWVFNWVVYALYIGEGNGTPLQYSCLENPMDGGAWKAAVHGIAEGQTRLSDFPFTFHFHALQKEMATHSSVLAWRIPGTAGAWWAAVYGVAQSWTRLKWLSSKVH